MAAQETSQRDSGGSSVDEIAISVIMPVYNSEDYVESAVVSLLVQDFNGFEIIAIDDGSIDRSGAILDRLARADHRLRVLHRKNGGHCSARNQGIDIARGKYVTFCDNDDMCLEGFLRENYALAEETGADCVRFGIVYRRIDAVGNLMREAVKAPPVVEVCTVNQIADKPRTFYYGSGGVWSGLYRRAFLIENGIQFDERLRSGREDILFNDQVFSKAENIAFNNEVYYVWQRRESHSASTVVSDNRLLGFSLVFEKENELFCESGLLEKHPTFLTERFIAHVMDTLTSSHYNGSNSYENDCITYEKARELLEPYWDKLYAPGLDFQYAVIRDLLRNRCYRLLYRFVSAGVIYRRITQKK